MDEATRSQTDMFTENSLVLIKIEILERYIRKKDR